VAYKLMPQQAPLLLTAPDSSVTKRGAFATKHLWVTPHSDDERWCAGDYTIQSSGGEGLPKWTAANRSLAPGADPVLWHTFGATHVPRPEDFPVMPCEVAGERRWLPWRLCTRYRCLGRGVPLPHCCAASPARGARGLLRMRCLHPGVRTMSSHLLLCCLNQPQASC
jgi:hypothetical protein